MKELVVNLPDNRYSIYIEKGLLEKISDYIKDMYKGKKIAIITDENVNLHYGDKIVNQLEKNEYIVKKVILPPGEKSKSVDSLLKVYDELLDFKITRSDLIIALGGGVIGDLTGFAASTLLRGIPFIQVPTSLLAQIDSSIGGKVAVDLPRGKNLVGSFYHPKAVFIDPECLRTLDKRVLSDGMAEVIKYGCIRDKEFFEKLETIKSEEELFENLDDIIYTCCDIKRGVVERDEKDTGERMILNFGHTIGHGIEKYYNFETYTHGEAVAIGMYIITKNSENQGLTKPGTSDKIRRVLENFNLPYGIDISNKENLLDGISVDKKGEGEYLNLILIKDIGDVFIHKIKKDEVINFL